MLRSGLDSPPKGNTTSWASCFNTVHRVGTIVNPGELLRKYLVERESSALKAWFKHFDIDRSGTVTWKEFREALTRLQYPASPAGIWKDLDPEDSGAITLEEICSEEAELWNRFRRWCAAQFESSRDMLLRLKDSVQVGNTVELLRPEEFADGLIRCGWDGGSEMLLFEAMDVQGDGQLAVRELKWVDTESQRYRQKQDAKRKTTAQLHLKAVGKFIGRIELAKFKVMLRRSFGSTYQAWRRALDLDGSMTLQKAELFKVCRLMNWKGDVRVLWSSLDKVGNGVTTLEQLDPQCAHLLALFKDWAERTFGIPLSTTAWKVLDRRHKGKLTLKQFAQECQGRGFTNKTDTLVGWLDWQDKQYLVQQDLQVFDRWRPPLWLTAKPNADAAAELKRLMKQRYGHYIKAWRMVMDKDNSNCCSWYEFVEAAKQLKFHGDVAGAWLALDDDLSGSISLKEIDPASHAVLVQFKRWATQEFGSVRSAFDILDKDRSGELTFAEFSFAVRSYAYNGDLKMLFDCLDYGGENRLQMREVSFLDDWEDCAADLFSEAESSGEFAKDLQPSGQRSRQLSTADGLVQYQTDNPGPGAYDVVSGLGALPSMPSVRHSGAFSFTSRRPLWPKSARVIGPGSYEVSGRPASQGARRPAWSFSTQRRPANARIAEATSPGPGAYDAAASRNGPEFSMTPRRGVPMHPLQRPFLANQVLGTCRA